MAFTWAWRIGTIGRPTKSAEFAQLLLTGGLWLRARLVLFLSKLNGVRAPLSHRRVARFRREREAVVWSISAHGRATFPAIRWFIFFFFLNYTDWISRHHFISYSSLTAV